MAVEVRFKDAEVLKIGPDDRLLIKIDWWDEDLVDEFREALMDHLKEIGLAERAIVINTGGSDIELALIEPTT